MADGPQQTRPALRALVALAVVLVAVTLAVVLGKMGTDTILDGQRQDGVSPHSSILIEAASLADLPPPLQRLEDPDASNHALVAVPDMDRNLLRKAPAAEYPFDAAQAGEYRLWLRAWWRDGCGNSFAAGMDRAPLAAVGNDGTYGVWHWVEGPVFVLAAGSHRLRLAPRESGARVDQMLLVNDLGYTPQGILIAQAKTGATGALARGPSAGEAPAAPWLSTGRAPKERFAAAVGGAYRGGPESILVGLGIPCDRLREDELSDPAALARYRVIWLSAPQTRVEEVWKAVLSYVRGGGTAILEKMSELGWEYTDEQHQLLSGARFENECRGGLTVRGKGSVCFGGLPEDAQVHPDVECAAWGDLRAGRDLELHGELRNGNWRAGPVYFKRRVGQGTVYALALPMGFHTMWRATTFDGVARKLVLEAVAGRYAPLYAEFKPQPIRTGTVHFADDFMRTGSEQARWKIESGQFRLTGPEPPQPLLAFALRGTGEGSVGAKDDSFRAYRISAAVLADKGACGVWLTTTRGRRLLLAYDGESGRVSLNVAQPPPAVPKGSTGEGAGATLAEATAPPPLAGWRRLGLFMRDGAWQGWLDGEQVLKVPADGEDAAGRFGLATQRGEVYYDDVRVRDVAALVPGRDTCLGEEGSPLAEPPMTRGLEPRTIYSPQWYFRPDPEGRHAFKVPLPLFAPAQLSLDGRALGRVAPDASGPLVYLPEGEGPRRELTLVTPTWRDYTFGKRLVEWYGTGGEWKQQPRWSCDPRWEWLGVAAPRVGMLIHRRRLAPPYGLYVLAAAAMSSPYREDEQGRDLNLILGGNGKDLSAGYVVRVGPSGEMGAELWKGKTRLTAVPRFGLPKGHALHHRWFALQAIVERERIRFFYEGQLAFDVPLAEPPGPGYVGFWTQANTVRVARATISAGPDAGGGEGERARK